TVDTVGGQPHRALVPVRTLEHWDGATRVVIRRLRHSLDGLIVRVKQVRRRDRQLSVQIDGELGWLQGQQDRRALVLRRVAVLVNDVSVSALRDHEIGWGPAVPKPGHSSTPCEDEGPAEAGPLNGNRNVRTAPRMKATPSSRAARPQRASAAQQLEQPRSIRRSRW